MSHSSDGHGEGLHEDIPEFRKDCSILIDVGDNKRIKAREVLIESVRQIGNDGIMGVVPRSGNMYEVTVKNKADLDLLEEGLWLQDRECPARRMVQDSFVASMMYLPTYIEDQEIKSRLNVIGVDILSPIKRRYIEWDNIKVADGTRFCKVRLAEGRKSLPFTMKFSDGESEGYYRVIHDGQCKTCSICGSNDHLKKECPKYVCYRCGTQGHIKRFCAAEKCPHCLCYKCECGDNYTEEMREEMNDETGNEPEMKNDRCNDERTESVSLCEKCGIMSADCICQRFEKDEERKDDNDEDDIVLESKAGDDRDKEKDVNDDDIVKLDDDDLENKLDDENKNGDADDSETNDPQNDETEHETLFGDVLNLEPVLPAAKPTRETPESDTLSIEPMQTTESSTYRKRSIDHSHSDTVNARMKIRATDRKTDKVK